MPEILVSVIIVAYNNGDELVECVESIYRNNDIGKGLEVIIVDNSPDECVENLLGRDERVSIFYNTDNGFGKGNNIGESNSKGKYILFLNPDTLLVEPIFEDLICIYEKHSDCGSIGVKLINKEGEENNSYNIRLNYGLLKKMLLKFSRMSNIYIPKLMYTCGADIFIERKVFESIGGFDENIELYGEEQDIAFRMDIIGKKMYYRSDYTIIHLQGASGGGNEVRNRIRILKSSEYICKKYGYDFKRLMRSEYRYMRLINFICRSIGRKPRYRRGVMSLYE